MSFWSYLKFWNSKKRNAENRGDQQLVTSSSATQIQQRVGEKRDNGNGGLHVESGVSEPKKPRMSSEEEIRNYNAVKKPNGAVSAERMSVDTTEEDDEDLVLLGFHSGTSSANTSNLISESPKSQEEPSELETNGPFTPSALLSAFSNFSVNDSGILEPKEALSERRFGNKYRRFKQQNRWAISTGTAPNFITAAQRVIPLRDASLWSGTKSAQKNNERQGELQPSTLSWATQSRQSEGNDINGEFLFEATPKKPWMTAVADLQKAESAQKEDNSGEEELVEDEEDDLVVLGVYPALPSEDFFDDTLMTPDSSQKHIQRFKEEFSKTTSRRRTEEVGSSSASVDTSGRSTPATIQSTLSNSTVDDCMILGALEACDERRYENKYRRYNEHRRMNTKTIGAGNAMTRFSEIGFRSQSRMFKELDSLTLDLKRSLRIEGLRLERLELPEKDEFPPIPAESIELIGRIWGGGPLNEVFGKSGDGTNITRKDLMTLKGLDWLNDEIVNCYLNMICERAKENPGKMPKVHAYNTFFYPNLTTKGYTSVRRWTRRVDIFAHDLLIVPVHLGAHWCLAIVDVANKAIQYYDSMLGNNPMALSALKEYLEQEAKDKKKEVIDTSGWKLETRKDIPRQMNGSDCGMFACKFAEYASRRAPINFTQHHMPYFRQRMVHEICTKRLM